MFLLPYTVILLIISTVNGRVSSLKKSNRPVWNFKQYDEANELKGNFDHFQGNLRIVCPTAYGSIARVPRVL